MAWSEKRIHAWLGKRRAGGEENPRVVGSGGNDATVLRRPPGREVICVDQTIEGVHCEVGTSPRKIGRKAASRAISDLAATAARPRALLLALTAPRSTPEAWIRAAILGVDDGAAAFGVSLVGGDLACSAGRAVLSVTALGVLEGTRKPPGRNRAKPGQLLVLTGPLGGSSLGRHLTFSPRIEEGRWLHSLGATAMMDVSDGLALDLSRLALASGVGIQLEKIPVHADARRLARISGRTPRDHALHDGEDHELIATLPESALGRLQSESEERCPSLVVAGIVTDETGLWLPSEKDDGWESWAGEGGWIHGET